MPTFMPGMKLCECFYHEAVHPILASHFAGLVYSAARLDAGSDVLGFDTPQSRDHHWGPKVMVFLFEADYEVYPERIVAVLAQELPFEIHGYPTHFAIPEIDGGILQHSTRRPINHGVTVTTSRRFFRDYLGFHPLDGIREVDWLLAPQQRLRTISSGKVFHDGLNELTPARNALGWYSHDVWLYLLACQWRRIDQEEPFMARCGDVGDELGSRLVAARLVNEVMRLCFLMERQYAPYYKWFGTAFARLTCASHLTPIFQAVFNSQDWKAREQHLSEAYQYAADMHNRLGITEQIEPQISQFHNRPYLVPHSERFVEALYRQIQSAAVKQWPRDVGAVWQFADSTDVLSRINRCQALGAVYQA